MQVWQLPYLPYRRLPPCVGCRIAKKCMQAFERRKLFVLFTLIFELSSLSMYWSENIAPEPKTANFPPEKSEYNWISFLKILLDRCVAIKVHETDILHCVSIHWVICVFRMSCRVFATTLALFKRLLFQKTFSAPHLDRRSRLEVVGGCIGRRLADWEGMKPILWRGLAPPAWPRSEWPRVGRGKSHWMLRQIR